MAISNNNSINNRSSVGQTDLSSKDQADHHHHQHQPEQQRHQRPTSIETNHQSNERIMMNNHHHHYPQSPHQQRRHHHQHQQQQRHHHQHVNHHQHNDDDQYRQMASTLVDNLLAKAIVKASQELAFTHCRDLVQHQQSQSDSRRSSQQSSMMRTMENSANMVDMNGNNNENPPEIQIDLVGPRTPSPVEESDLEIPSVPVKQYKFKVQYDADSMCNMEDYSADSSMDDGIIDQSVGSSELPLNQHYVAKRLSMSAIVNNNVVDVATTPELEIDLAQAQEISKHIVTEIINQAVDILNKENQNPNNCSKVAKYKDTAGSMAATGSTTIKRETESYSKISCHSSRTNASITGNCSWINRARHALSRVMRNACLCTKTKENHFHV